MHGEALVCLIVSRKGKTKNRFGKATSFVSISRGIILRLPEGPLHNEEHLRLPHYPGHRHLKLHRISIWEPSIRSHIDFDTYSFYASSNATQPSHS